MSFTPTDSLHVLEEYSEGDLEAAEVGASVLGEKMGLSSIGFSKRIKQEMEKSVASEVIKKLILEEIDDCYFENNPLWEYLIREDKGTMDIKYFLDYPIVGIGAPVDAFLPQVADRLGTDYVDVNHYEVGNAVGAVASGVIAKVEIIISKDPEENNFIFITPDEREVSQIEDEEEAMKYCKDKAKKIAVEKVQKAGGEDIEVEIQRESFSGYRGRVLVIGIGYPIGD
ncbi:hypothetical protein AKJ52_00540 [candidate division MSBL1 archaeon SCGC-AAA382C18]|uniref:Uncharacterized protein n=1 Tax=candidate division MSBL1 archaeon SCGC-AAA382C18 TaxID=1698281 RepID=A0A133VLJ0_9EURY|nr:hypothetical protein AKJ52_00540 [candidate division MSBL1 archaeon SCGC-AAA382C18]